MVLLALLAVTLAPIWLIVLTALSPFVPFGKWRPLRVGWLLLLHVLLEAGILLALLVLWVVSGFGWAIRRPAFQRTHYDIVQFYLSVLFRECRRVLGVRVEVDGPSPASYQGRPLLVFCRHAGPGDSFLLIHALVNWYDREPRIVLKDTLQWDPVIDVLLGRLPNRFIRPAPSQGGEALVRQIGELASGLDDNDAFVIFPEGGNFTARRKARAIARLRADGLVEAAKRAEQLRYVLPPRPGGVGAALQAAPDADVVWVAHTGTDHLMSVADVWHALPLDQTIRMRWWQVPAGEVPEGEEERLAWLNDWWKRIDDWIDEHRDVERAPAGPPG
ncbi:1-acyl-sn-glycerol-3-phosphate acyltransferase [Angustibacter sp. McL0619]|uniref:1-acyl-sn-glycerol-3-phosphate acyltransferase n=1 Tax=Angustibacter sp. McL0619 TaxID=3415676 RepID=UPI003CFAF363